MDRTAHLFSAVWLCGIFFYSPACSMASDFKYECIKAFMDVENPFRYFKPDEWVVEALFFDFDGDGKMQEAFLASPDQRYADGNGWVTTRKNNITGKFEYHPTVGENSLDLFARSRKLYVVSFEGVRDRLYGNDVTIYDIKNFGASNETQNIYRDDVLLRMDTNGFLRATSMKNGFSDLVSNSGFKRLDRAMTEFYKGKEVKFVKRSETATDISLSRPKEIEEFVRQYRKEMKRRFAVKRKVNVYVVFLDADNDGNADFYVSSDIEKRQNGQYEWHLFLNAEGKFAKAEKTMWFNADKWYNRESINPDEVAGKDSFYRVQRRDGFLPSTIILERDGDTLHSRTSLRQRLSQPPPPPSKHPTCEQQKEYYRAKEEWQWEQKSKLGFIPAYDFEELIVWHDFLRLERLPCEEFSE